MPTLRPVPVLIFLLILTAGSPPAGAVPPDSVTPVLATGQTPSPTASASVPPDPGAEQSTAPPAEGGAGQPVFSIFDPVEHELLILKVKFGRRWSLGETMVGFLHRGGVQLPLGGLTGELDFAIEVDPATGTATGWFVRENRSFALDFKRRVAVVQGQTRTFNPDLVWPQPEDIYVDTTLLAEWFGLSFDNQLASLSIDVSAKEKLPFEKRKEREGRRDILGARGALKKPEYDRFTPPYRLFSLPFVDASYDHIFDSLTDQSRHNYSTVVSNDLLYMQSRFFFGGNDQEPFANWRFNLGRVDVDRNLLGALRVSEYDLGDVFNTQIPLTATSRVGAGFRVSSFPFAQQSEFDRTNLRGELPQGWEVELYRNEVLLDSQTSRADGRYEFLDVPLLFGNNVLRLIFYGPQGQRRETVQTFTVGQGQIRPGRNYFRLSTNLQDTTLQTIADEEEPDSYDDLARYFVEYQAGLSRLWSLSASFASYTLNRERLYFGSLGLRTGLFGAFSRLDVSHDVGNEGTAVEFATQTAFGGVSLLAQHAQFFDFQSERFQNTTDPVKSRSSLRLNFNIPSWGIVPQIPFAATGQATRRESGETDYRITNRLSMFLGGVSVSNNLTATLRRGGNQPPTDDLTGSVLMNTRLWRLSLRGTLNYELEPINRLQDLTGTLDYNFTQNFGARVTVTKQLQGLEQTSYEMALNTRFQSFALGVTGIINDDGDFSVGTTFTFSFGLDPRTNSPIMRSDRLATSGSASARVFLDQNQNGIYDAGTDEPLPGVQFQPGGKDIQTDEQGIAFIPGISANRPTDVTVQKKTLDDPFWILPDEGFEVVTRPGRAALLEFPVIQTGEVDGTVFLLKGGAESAVSNVALQMVDEQGKVAYEVKSEFDGFYLFTFVRPGKYILRVNPEQVERLNLKTSPQQEVVITAKGNVESGRDMVLEIRSETPTESQAPKAPLQNIPAPETGPQEAPVPEAPPLAIPQGKTPAQETESQKP